MAGISYVHPDVVVDDIALLSSFIDVDVAAAVSAPTERSVVAVAGSSERAIFIVVATAVWNSLKFVTAIPTAQTSHPSEPAASAVVIVESHCCCCC